jgi:hypothetical protein
VVEYQIKGLSPPLVYAPTRYASKVYLYILVYRIRKEEEEVRDRFELSRRRSYVGQKRERIQLLVLEEVSESNGEVVFARSQGRLPSYRIDSSSITGNDRIRSSYRPYSCVNMTSGLRGYLQFET